MKAALIRELGDQPEVADVAEPEGDVLDVLAAPLNTVDVNVSRGLYFAGHPELPYVPGCEAVGRTADGRLVWIYRGGLGLARNGALAQRAAIGDADVVEVPEDVDPALAGALGIAGLAGWLPFAWRAPLQGGETVLILGATGTVGFVAVQTAKLLGAARVVAAGRDPERLERTVELGADATIRLDRTDDLVAAFRDAFDGGGPSYVFDALWGEPAAAAVQAARERATIVNLGQSAAPTSELASGAVRGKNLSILGHTNFGVPPADLAEQYVRLVRRATAGDIRLDVERIPLARIGEAWQRQADGAGTKLVIEP
jgi:NADPH:quinone reductase